MLPKDRKIFILLFLNLDLLINLIIVLCHFKLELLVLFSKF